MSEDKKMRIRVNNKKKTVVCICIPVLAIWMLTGCGSRDEAMESGIEKLKAGEYAAAAERFEEAAEASGLLSSYKELTIQLYYAEALAGMEDYDTALANYDKILSELNESEIKGNEKNEVGRREQTGMVYRLRGIVQLKNNAYAEAVPDLNTAAEQYGQEDCSYYLGQAYFGLKDYKSACACFEQAAAEAAHERAAYYEAVCYEYMGDFSTAREKMAVYVETHSGDEEAKMEYDFLLTR